MVNSMYEYDRVFLKNKKIIIYGILEDSQCLALRLIQENIFFEGFLFLEKDNRLQSLFNKPVFNLEEMQTDMDHAALLVPFGLKNEGMELKRQYAQLEKCITYEIIKEEVINADNIIVYGSGEYADRLVKSAIELKVSCYFDSNKKKAGTFHNGIIVNHPSIRKELKGTTAVIIASIYYAAMYQLLLECGYLDNEIFVDIKNIFINEDKGSYLRINRVLFACLGKNLYKKRVILYGKRKTVDKVQNVFSHIGIDFSSVIGRENDSEDGTIYNLFYENQEETDMLLMTDESNLFQYEILKKMNYSDRKIIYISSDIMPAFAISAFFHSYKFELLHMGLDPILGYGKFSEKKESMLFAKHVWIRDDCERLEKKPLRIVTLGGSTTDEDGIRNKSWPEYLCDYLYAHNISYELYNGGVEGFTASQELMKLVRDVVELKPDICISYSGINNIYSDNQCADKFPFIHNQQKIVFDRLNLHFDIWGKRAACIEWGIGNNGARSDFWLSQIRMQKAICDTFSIKYLSILQPDFFTKTHFMEKDQEFLAWMDTYVDNGKLVSCNDNFRKQKRENKEFQTSISDKIKNEDYIYDMRSIFDDIDGAYVDLVHVYSFANKIIAEKIYKLLENRQYLGKES